MSQLPTTAMGVFRQLSVSKSGIEIFSRQIIQSVQNGETDPLELLAFLKTLEKIVEAVKEGTKDNIKNALDKYSEKSFDAFGVRFEKAEVGTKYDYSVCGDPIYNHRAQIAEEAAAQLKEREAFLKSLKEPINIVDDESGELARVIPPLKKSTEGVKTYFK